MICRQRFLHSWVANAHLERFATLTRKVAANANGITALEREHSFGAGIQSNKNRPKSHGKPRKSHNPSVKEDARQERPQKSP